MAMDAMIMLPAPMVVALTLVFVMKDLQGMDSIAQVGYEIL